MTHNTEVEEGVDELEIAITGLINAYCLKTFGQEMPDTFKQGKFVIPDLIKNSLKKVLHHQLQKAREEERKRILSGLAEDGWFPLRRTLMGDKELMVPIAKIVNIINGAGLIATVDPLESNPRAITSTKRYHSELDKDKK